MKLKNFFVSVFRDLYLQFINEMIIQPGDEASEKDGISDVTFEDHVSYRFMIFNPLADDKILDLSKLKQITDNILKCI